ncbi:hypothetical protein [Bradyrhizobium sp. AUGA SZCCT0283]|uniref:hypothetical protein n=1 Tax=Bradyrhizobium sp. AUGA SZCCT0283 TaxID=2807671 RepID=UPI001BA6A163|nr:hypothetical protein [Bradyrhizobium sp. AUGA SZCCT0283]MBR1280311.1 hypothetical protein [Bradyrhizobium sp. AUGA SZCCT0283]
MADLLGIVTAQSKVDGATKKGPSLRRKVGSGSQRGHLARHLLQSRQHTMKRQQFGRLFRTDRSCTIPRQKASTEAPPFSALAKRPGFDKAKVAFFLLDPHPKMPNMQLSRAEVADIAA